MLTDLDLTNIRAAGHFFFLQINQEFFCFLNKIFYRYI